MSKIWIYNHVYVYIGSYKFDADSNVNLRFNLLIGDNTQFYCCPLKWVINSLLYILLKQPITMPYTFWHYNERQKIRQLNTTIILICSFFFHHSHLGFVEKKLMTFWIWRTNNNRRGDLNETKYSNYNEFIS